jgi:hypothetical protein
MSEVALLTHSIAVRKAAAKAVAVSRLAAKVANIVVVPFLWSSPSLGPQPSMQGPCQMHFPQ